MEQKKISPENQLKQHPYAASGWERFRKAFTYSLEGFKHAYRVEEAFKQEIWQAVVLAPIALMLPVSWTGKALMIGSMLIALAIELLNTGVEAAIDRISFEEHPLAKVAKDVGSTAVFLGLANVVVIWLGVLLDRFWPLNL
ncbi:diacylglycerol kinase [Deltaproteobacteria bacterium TL4]